MEISTIGQCALELILNSLDARTTGVAVRFHSEEKRIQVVDCGVGIPPDILTRICEPEKKNGNISKILGYNHSSRGESLKQILELSQICIITSKCEGSIDTYEKVFKTGETPIFLKGNRPSKGTAVTICGFEGSGWNSASNAIHFAILSLALIHINVSFTLHDQLTGELVTGIHKPHEPYDILNLICDEPLSLETTWHLNSTNSSEFKISGYIGYFKMKSKIVRHIFINRRPMRCQQIDKLILEMMNSLRDELRIPSIVNIYFLIYIECPLSDFILSSYAGRTFAIFQYWQKISNNIKACIMNSIMMNNNQFMKAGCSNALESNETYGIADKAHMENNNNFKVNKSNRKESSIISNRNVEKKVAKTLISPINPKLIFQTQLEDKMPKQKYISIFRNIQKDIFEKEFECENRKTETKPLFKKNFEEKFRKPLENQETKAKDISIFKKNHKAIFVKPFENPNVETKQFPDKQVEGKKVRAKQCLIFKKNHNKFFGDKLEDKKVTTQPVALFEKHHKEIFGKRVSEKKAKAKQVSIFEMCSKDKIINPSELKKTNDCKAIANHIRKREQFSIENDLALLNKSLFESLMLMKDRILNNHIKTPTTITEEKNQPNQEKTYQLNREDTYHSYESEAYHLNQEATDYEIQKKSIESNIGENNIIRIFGNTQSQFDHDLEQNQNVTNQDKPESKKIVKNHFDTGEQALELVNLNDSTQKIDPESCSQLSEWSDWNYNWPISKETFQLPESKKVEYHRLYHFLPPILNSMLRYGKTNIISEANIQDNSDNICSTTFNLEMKPNQIISRYQNLNVRLCVVPHSKEFNLNRKSLYSIQVLRQINLEFIAALAEQDDKILLLMIDQHAADERIRYEDLLQSYKIDAKKQYFSVGLHQPIQITDIEPKKCELLLSNESIINKFGVRFKSDSLGSLTVTTIPRCFLKKRSFDSDFKMACSVRNLLLEIIENLESTNSASILPKSIHNAIASEACRGAVKFGDPLTIDQCYLLIQSLRETNAPNRCAHGRPSVIPLLDVTDLKKKRTKTFQGKLNFASLKKTLIKNK